MNLRLIHPDGWKFVAIFALVTCVLGYFSDVLLWLGIILTSWCIYFFRTPVRVTPLGNDFVISPADGKVILIKKVAPPKAFEMSDEECFRVSIFLNVFDVHVNKVPMSGTIEKVIYHPGKFVNASFDKASDDNERNTIVVKNDRGIQVAATQIAGLIARRIVCNVHEKSQVLAGQEFGLIRFGSRVDVYLPVGVEPLVVVGQRAIAGETILAHLTSGEKQREGEVR
jgi:phosphatidylserine decarboxylase